MIYEVRTYALKPGTVAEFEERFAESLPYRQKYSKLGAFWHTEFGPLNEVIHVWPYEDFQERTAVRAEAAKDPHWPPRTGDVVVSMESEIMIPAPFMEPLGDRQLGNVYEMRTYTYRNGTMPEVLKRWSEAIPHRLKYSPLAACWYTELGNLNKWVHVWAYKDVAERDRVRAEARNDPHWPPSTREFAVKQENKLLIPAAFSPMK